MACSIFCKHACVLISFKVSFCHYPKSTEAQILCINIQKIFHINVQKISELLCLGVVNWQNGKKNGISEIDHLEIILTSDTLPCDKCHIQNPVSLFCLTSSFMSSCCWAVKISIAAMSLIINSSTVVLPDNTERCQTLLYIITSYFTKLVKNK